MIPCCILAIENDDDKEFMIALYEDYKRLMFFEVGKIVGQLHHLYLQTLSIEPQSGLCEFSKYLL